MIDRDIKERDKSLHGAHGYCPMCDGKGYNILEYFVGETEAELEQKCPKCDGTGVLFSD